jgi:D-threo-aldose 1-dehydrogenase
LTSKIIIGTWPLSGDYGKIDYAKIKDVLEYCYESGIREFDSAPNYGNGVIEKYLGIIFENRTDVLVNTKMGNQPFNKKNYDLKQLKKSFENSLKLLKRDSINTLFLHNPRMEITDYTDVLNFMHELKDKGKISQIGLSMARNFSYT